eukprot:1735102-Prymnesium_polylepis.1
MICSEGLINSLVAYYMGTTYISWEEAEKWEATWRAIFNKKSSVPGAHRGSSFTSKSDGRK